MTRSGLLAFKVRQDLTEKPGKDKEVNRNSYLFWIKSRNY